MNNPATRLFANLEQVKEALTAHLHHQQHNHKASLETLKTQRDRASAAAKIQGLSDGIEYAIAAIDDYLSTPTQYKRDVINTLSEADGELEGELEKPFLEMLSDNGWKID